MVMLDLPLSAEQQMLRDSVQRFLSENAWPGWRDLVDSLGLAGVAVPERHGGFGGGAIDIAVVMTGLGPALAGADWLSHTVACLLIARVAADHSILTGLANGSRRAALVCAASSAEMPVIDADGAVRGTATLVAGGAEADVFVLADGDAVLVFAADGDKFEQRHRIMHDGSVTADLSFAVKAGEADFLATGAEARALTEWVNDAILVGRCAEAVGLIQCMIAASVEYLGQRKQFGRAIGSFQTLRHRAADIQLAAMKAAALAEAAVLAVDQDRADRAAVVSAACVEVADAVRIVGEGAVQIHGAMGLTEELNLGRHYKRALAIAAAMGSRADHLARFAEAAA